MIYVKAKALVEEYEAEDVIVTSTGDITNTDDDCAFTEFDAVNCDGVTQAVSKSQFGT